MVACSLAPPPDNARNPDDTRRTGLDISLLFPAGTGSSRDRSSRTRLVAITGMAVLVLLAIAAPFTSREPWRHWAALLPLIAIAGVTLHLAVSGRPRAAAAVAIGPSFVACAFAFFFLGGLHSSIVVAFPALVAVAGSIANNAAALAVSIASIAVMSLALVLDATGLVPTARMETSGLHSLLRTSGAVTVVMAGTMVLRRLGEAAVREASQSESRYAMLIEQAPDAHVFMDRERRVRYMNPATERLVGYPLAELSDRKFDELPIFPEAFRAAAAKAYDSLLVRHEGPPPPPREAELIHRDGSRVHVEVNRRPVVISGEIRGVQYTIRDISERKRAEATRARLEADLQEARRLESIGRLAGGVAHDFNNLLTVILGQSQLLLYQPLPQDTRDQVAPIVQAADRARNLIRQLLAFARKQTIAPRVLDPNTVLHDLEPLLRAMTGSRIALSLDLDERAGSIRIDPIQLDQVITNLVANARDAVTNDGQIVVRTRGEGQRVIIAVEDNGAGMSDDVRGRMFEPFFTTKPPGRGTGLGLSVVEGIVSQNGGTIEVESAPGKGARIAVALPRVAAESPRSPAPSPPPA